MPLPLFAALLAAILVAAPARAETDLQAWGGIVATGTVRGNLFVWAEGQARATNDIGGGSQFIARPAIGARIGRDAHAVVGYARVRTDAPGPGAVGHEDRLWQQVQFAPVRRANGAPLILSRTRLEQRFVSGSRDTGWRLRQFVRFQTPVARDSRLLAVAFTEGFVNLNATDYGARGGLDQVRSFAGIGVPLSPKLRLEPGYLNQYISRRGPDRVNHILNATLFVAL